MRKIIESVQKIHVYEYTMTKHVAHNHNKRRVRTAEPPPWDIVSGKEQKET